MSDSDLSQGFPHYQRPPTDIVPHAPDPDAPPIQTGLQPVTFTEFDEHGVTRTETTMFIGPAITSRADLHNRKESDTDD